MMTLPFLLFHFVLADRQLWIIPAPERDAGFLDSRFEHVCKKVTDTSYKATNKPVTPATNPVEMDEKEYMSVPAEL
jgi:hypothetical protein